MIWQCPYQIRAASCLSQACRAYMRRHLTHIHAVRFSEYTREPKKNISCERRSRASSLADVMDVVADQTGIAIKELKIDGGASKNDLLAQSFADFIRCKVVRPQESAGLTAAGAARLAAVGAGIYTMETLPETETETDKFYPMIDEETAKRKLSRYRDAVERAKAWMK